MLPNISLKNIFIVIASLFFYAWGEQEVVLIMITSIVVDYYAAILIEGGKRKLGLIMSLTCNLGLLLTFKYLDFAIGNINELLELLQINYSLAKSGIALPIGISFYTFQTMSYTIDVYRGNAKANRNIVEFATYVSLFPQLIAGPIVRYIDVVEQLKSRYTSLNDTWLGIERFMIGMVKKMVFANTFAEIADQCFGNAATSTSPAAMWMGTIAYSCQIYFDFSAYSDMAIGLSRVFGFKIPENLTIHT